MIQFILAFIIGGLASFICVGLLYLLSKLLDKTISSKYRD